MILVYPQTALPQKSPLLTTFLILYRGFLKLGNQHILLFIYSVSRNYPTKIGNFSKAFSIFSEHRIYK